MIVKHLDEIIGTPDDVEADTWVSRRFLLKKDGMGFSMHETTMKAGSETRMHYRNHLEAVYCIGGEGEIETIADGKVYPIRPGTLYALDQHDEHILRAHKEKPLRLVCVFNPPVTGREVHDENGVYPLVDDNAA
ncbi:MAG TPA: ectoine synthase [Gammaproteobacteria bacterium]|nr:ectoine synthase [Gammaproteobacteria bacterium]